MDVTVAVPVGVLHPLPAVRMQVPVADWQSCARAPRFRYENRQPAGKFVLLFLKRCLKIASKYCCSYTGRHTRGLVEFPVELVRGVVDSFGFPSILHSVRQLHNQQRTEICDVLSIRSQTPHLVHTDAVRAIMFDSPLQILEDHS